MPNKRLSFESQGCAPIDYFKKILHNVKEGIWSGTNDYDYDLLEEIKVNIDDELAEKCKMIEALLISKYKEKPRKRSKDIFFATNMQFIRMRVFKLTITELCKKINIKRTIWDEYEKGKSTPNIKELTRISNIVGISEYDLLHTNLFQNTPLVIFDNENIIRN